MSARRLKKLTLVDATTATKVFSKDAIPDVHGSCKGAWSRSRKPSEPDSELRANEGKNILISSPHFFPSTSKELSRLALHDLMDFRAGVAAESLECSGEGGREGGRCNRAIWESIFERTPSSYLSLSPSALSCRVLARSPRPFVWPVAETCRLTKIDDNMALAGLANRMLRPK